MDRARIHVIGDRDTVLGLHLAGVGGTTVDSADGAREALERALEWPRLQLLLVARPWADHLADRLDELVHRSDQPLVLEIPGPGAESPTAPVDEIVRRALGMGAPARKEGG
jgi:vacuolar-type H+-ATPase subunit F/Vma7